jgi:serine protease
MKESSFKRSVVILLALLFVLGAVMPALGARETRVWVEYRPGQHAAIRGELQRAGAQFHYQFDSLDSFVVSIPERALVGLSRNPNILSIEVDPVRELVRNMPSSPSVQEKPQPGSQVVPYGIDMVQARDIWDANRDGRIDRNAPTGAGRTVCIIDTGYFTDHEDLLDIDVGGGYSQTNTDPGLWTYDGHGHGTHVAGTIAAANNTVGVVGVTPGAVSLYIVKIFGDDGLWLRKAHSSDLVAAALLCANNGANIISMSLSGTLKSGKEERAFNSLYASGVLSIAAASNDGIEEYHYPASYDSVVSVAALDENYMVADFSQYNDQVELAAPGVDVLSTVPFIDQTYLEVNSIQYTAYSIEFAASGQVSGSLVDGGRCLTTGEWSGAVVLCERGDISFYEKVMNVQNSGGTAAVIYNNEPGNFYGTLGDGNSSLIPAVSISQEDGQYLTGYKLGATATINVELIMQASGYEAWSGTSMATPHVSGVAALIWSWNPSLTNVQIREAMQMTALDLGETGRDHYYGFGLVQAYDAWQYLGGGTPGKK